MNGAAENTEVRVKPNKTFEISTNECSKSNFGWILAKTIYKQEELIDKNFYGNRKNLPAVSPKRHHAIERAVGEVNG